jgi:hypothetical protein
MEATCYSETPLIFNELHGVISQKTELFITTAVRASNHKTNLFFIITVRFITSKGLEINLNSSLHDIFRHLLTLKGTYLVLQN